MSCPQLDSDGKHTSPKRKRGFRRRSPHLRFGLVWPVRHMSVSGYRINRHRGRLVRDPRVNRSREDHGGRRMGAMWADSPEYRPPATGCIIAMHHMAYTSPLATDFSDGRRGANGGGRPTKDCFTGHDRRPGPDPEATADRGGGGGVRRALTIGLSTCPGRGSPPGPASQGGKVSRALFPRLAKGRFGRVTTRAQSKR